MNKTQLVDALAERLGDRRTAATAVDGLLQTIVDTVRAGDSVSLTGFGVFESRARAARTARNPQTGDVVDVPATTVPAFRPGASFRSAVGAAAGPAPRAAAFDRRSTTATAVSTDTAPPGQKATSDGSFASSSGKSVGKAEKSGSGKSGKSAKASDKAEKGKKSKGKGKGKK
jgi:DNA-binding protein HU-beta